MNVHVQPMNSLFICRLGRCQARSFVHATQNYLSIRVPCKPSRLHSFAAVVDTQEAAAVEVITKTKRKYVMVSGKGGVGKTSLSASLAVKYAEAGHDTLVVSTDPAHSLGDSFAQDISGGKPVAIEGTDLPIWGLEIDPAKAADEFKLYARSGGRDSVKVTPLPAPQSILCVSLSLSICNGHR